MDILESGYRYRVYDLKKENPQEITFTRRNSLGGFDPGTTNEELIDVLISRMYFLNSNNPNPYNKVAIILLKSIREMLSKVVERKNNIKENRKNGTKNLNGERTKENPGV